MRTAQEISPQLDVLLRALEQCPMGTLWRRSGGEVGNAGEGEARSKAAIPRPIFQVSESFPCSDQYPVYLRWQIDSGYTAEQVNIDCNAITGTLKAAGNETSAEVLRRYYQALSTLSRCVILETSGFLLATVAFILLTP